MKSTFCTMRLMACVVVLGLSCGCGTPYERQLGTTVAYHALVQNPRIAPAADRALVDAPHYIIGVEKGDGDVVKRLLPCATGLVTQEKRYCLHLDTLPAASPWREKIVKQNERGKPLFVSHIARLDPESGNTDSRKACFLYNIYPRDQFPEAVECPAATVASVDSNTPSVAHGLDALSTLGNELERRILESPADQKPTHLIVMSTGWNTLQAESIGNYRQWISHLMSAATGDKSHPFHPLVIGLTWPSEWPLVSTWLGPVISAFNKENDADELGYVTANVFLHEILHRLKAKHGIPIIVVGHSFGGRAMVTAANSRLLLFQSTVEGPTIDLLIGLQPAFSIQRFGGGTQGDPFIHFPKGAQKYVLSSSTNDWILKAVMVTNPVGGSRGLSQAKMLPERFEVIPLNSSGEWVIPPSSDPCLMLMLDASEAINGHHDVYTTLTGRLMWHAIQTFAPASSWAGVRRTPPLACQRDNH